MSFSAIDPELPFAGQAFVVHPLSISGPFPLAAGGVDEPHQPFQQFDRRRRAARNVQIDRDHRRDRPGAGIASGEHSAISGAIAGRHHPFRIGRCGVGALQRLAHVPGHGAGDEKHIGVARGGNELKPEALDIVDGIAQRVDFKLAAVARAGIDLADGKRAPKLAARSLAQRLRQFLKPSARGSGARITAGPFRSAVSKRMCIGRA